tara:strand:+ start:173 stop:370 length:198 start_codon:yes stop_codon:yes gene_type:complete
MVAKWLIVHEIQGQFFLKRRIVMQLTKNIVRFNKMLVAIPKACKGLWDLSENRWGYKKIQYKEHD